MSEDRVVLGLATAILMLLAMLMGLTAYVEIRKAEIYADAIKNADVEAVVRLVEAAGE